MKRMKKKNLPSLGRGGGGLAPGLKGWWSLHVVNAREMLERADGSGNAATLDSLGGGLSPRSPACGGGGGR